MNFTKENDEVYRTDGLLAKVTGDDVIFLKEQAAKNERSRVRLCAHPGNDDLLHEMLIIHVQNTYVAPHKHVNKSESFHVIEGRVDVVLFDDDGKISSVIQRGDYSSGYCFYYRIADARYHTLLIHSDVLVFHETTNGPFIRSQTALAPWSPAENDIPAIGKFMVELTKTTASYLRDVQ